VLSVFKSRPTSARLTQPLPNIAASPSSSCAAFASQAVKMYEACVAMRNVMLELGVAVDGGKDSLSMAAKAPDVVPGEPDEVVKAPGQLVITYYALCTNVNLAVTPDLKLGSTGGDLIFLDLGEGNCRLGGSALAQVYGQIGEHVPDLDHPARLAVVFGVVQELILAQQISAGHDRSDGGLLTALLEMAFAGNAGIDVNIGLDLSSMGVEMDTLSTEGCRLTYAILATLFNEEIGLVFVSALLLQSRWKMPPMLATSCLDAADELKLTPSSNASFGPCRKSSPRTPPVCWPRLMLLASGATATLLGRAQTLRPRMVVRAPASLSGEPLSWTRAWTRCGMYGRRPASLSTAARRIPHAWRRRLHPCVVALLMARPGSSPLRRSLRAMPS